MAEQLINSYKGLAELYDRDQRDLVIDDIPFFLEYAKSVKGDILECACGTGRLLIPLARAGHNTFGIDITTDMLDYLDEKLDKEPTDVRKRVHTFEQDMTKFELGRKFDLIYIGCRTFQVLLKREDQVGFLRCVYNHLSDDGKFIIGTFHPEGFNDEWADGTENEWWANEDPETGVRYRGTHVRAKIDTKNQILYPELNYYAKPKNGPEEKYSQHLALKFYQVDELRDLVESTGLKVTEEYGYFDKCPIGEGTEIIFVCTK